MSSIQDGQDGGSSQLQPQKSEEDTARHRISCSPPPLDHVAEGTVSAEKGFTSSVSSFLPPEDDDDFGDFADFASHEPTFDHLQADTKATGAASVPQQVSGTEDTQYKKDSKTTAAPSDPQQVDEEENAQCKKEMATVAMSSVPQQISAEEDTPCKPDREEACEFVGKSDCLEERLTSEGQPRTPSPMPNEGTECGGVLEEKMVSTPKENRELESSVSVSESVVSARTGARVEVDSGISSAEVGSNGVAGESDVKEAEPSSDKGGDNDDFGDFSSGVVDSEGSGTGRDIVVAEGSDVKEVEPSSDIETGDNESDFGDFSSGVKDSEGPGIGRDRVVAEGSNQEEVGLSSNEKNDNDESDFGDFNRASDDDDDDLDFADLRKRVESGSLDDDFGDFSSGDVENKDAGGCKKVQGSVEEVGGGDDKGSDDFGDFTTPGNTEDKSAFDDFGDFTAPGDTEDKSDFGDFGDFGDFEGHVNEDGVTQDFSADDFGDFSAPGTSADLQGFSTTSGSAAAAVKEAAQQFPPSESGVSKANPVLQKVREFYCFL